MLRKIISYAFVLTIMAMVNVGVPSAHQEGGPQWITGEVVSIQEGEDGSLISLKMADGEIFNVAATNDLIEGINVGDVVTVQIVKGWAELVEIAKDNTPPTPRPEKKKSGAQWVAGEVVSIEEGETDSLVSIKMSNDKVFNVAVSNDKLEGVKVGSYITVKIVKGWAQKVSKKDAN